MFLIPATKILHSRPIQRIFYYSKYGPKSNEERMAEVQAQRFKVVQDSITSVLKRRKFLSVPEWKSLHLELQKISPYLKTQASLQNNIFNVLLSLRPPNDSLQNARTLVEAFEIKHDLALKKYLIQLLAKKASENKLTEKEEQELIDLCNEFIAQELHFLTEVNAIVINGLCATKEWKKALNLKNASSNSLNILIRKALRENEIDLVWSLLKKLTEHPEHYQHLANKTILNFVKYFENHPESNSKNVEKLLQFCERIKMVLDEDSARALANVLRRSDLHAKITTMDFSGVCGACNTSLKSVQITNKQFELVRTEFMNNVVKGYDIYHKTTPAEWEAFEQFIKQNLPFDIVMDGLNVAYFSNDVYRNETPKNHFLPRKKGRPSVDKLLEVVCQLAEEGKRILVIGRKHMDNWPRMNAVRARSKVFLVENISKDDIFLLYAALHSGQNSYILSNDFMRQHKFAIGKQFDAYFKLWQQDHWYGYMPGKEKTVDLFKPMQFMMYCHKVNEFWHLPFKSKKEIDLNTWSYYQLPKNWVCVRLKTD